MNNILVAEDNEISKLYISTVLTKQDCRCWTVSDGIELMKKFAETKFDLILMDIQMPKLSGLECTLKIREINKCIPIIGLTGYDHMVIKGKIPGYDFNEVLVKPVCPDQLVATISKHLKYSYDRVLP